MAMAYERNMLHTTQHSTADWNDRLFTNQSVCFDSFESQQSDEISWLLHPMLSKMILQSANSYCVYASFVDHWPARAILSHSIRQISRLQHRYRPTHSLLVSFCVFLQLLFLSFFFFGLFWFYFIPFYGWKWQPNELQTLQMNEHSTWSMHNNWCRCLPGGRHTHRCVTINMAL